MCLQTKQNLKNTSQTWILQHNSWEQEASPVGHLLQVHLLVAVEKLGDVVTEDAHEESDIDDGQDHPHAYAGIQQQLGTGHC